jgi:hypothetical protein
VKGVVDRAVAKVEVSQSFRSTSLESLPKWTASIMLVLEQQGRKHEIKDDGTIDNMVDTRPHIQSMPLGLPSHENHMNNTF